VGAFIFAQSQRWIEKVDLLIIAAITLGLVMFVPLLNSVIGIVSVGVATTQAILFVAVLTALLAVAVATIFRLIYNLLSRLF
jgi:uncharacterized membrane protein YjjP (DUF1212 family)